VRTGYESSNVDKILGGALNPYMNAWLAMRADSDQEKE